MKKHFYILYAFAALLCFALTGCGGAKLSVADEQMERGEYYDAANTYRKVYNKMKKREERPTRGVIAFKMGECYRRINMSARASAAYQNAIRYEYPDSMSYLYLAQSQHKEGKYAAAIKTYEEFLMRNPKSFVAQNGLAGSKMALEQKKKKTTRYVVKNAKFANIIGIDIWLNTLSDTPKQYDIVVYSTYNKDNSRTTGTITKKLN